MGRKATEPNPANVTGKAGWVTEGIIMKVASALLFGCLAAAGLLWGKEDICASQKAVFLFRDCLPQIENSVQDLDCRDLNNQSIQDTAAKNNLEEIFTTGLFDLLTNSEIHSIVNALKIIKKKLNLGADSFFPALPDFFCDVFAVILSSLKKQTDSSLILFSGFLPFKLFLVFLLAITSSIVFAPLRRIFEILRC